MATARGGGYDARMSAGKGSMRGASRPRSASAAGRTPLRRPALGALALAGAVALAYVPAMRAGYIWDDDDYVTKNPVLRDVGGLRRMWLEPRSIPQYYPLVHTTYWIEHRLWGLEPLGYHAVNAALHAAGAVLLWLLLRRLGLPAAFLAAAVWALHPVCVESVAWITERKNVLSGVFYFAAALAYLKFAGTGALPPARRRWGLYLLSFALFAAALLSKTVTATMPAAVVVVLWWKRDRLRLRDAAPLLPMLAVGIAMGMLTAYLEVERVRAAGEEWAFSPVERILIAGRVLWFYPGKLLWPAELIFIYPRWRIDPSAWWQYLFPLAALAAIAALWLLRRRPPGPSRRRRPLGPPRRRRIGKGPLAAVLIFAGTLFPVLGFLNVYPMRYSFVADHFQYIASAALIALFVAAAARAAAGLPAWASRAAPPAAAGLLLVLGLLTWNQSRAYRDLETLWGDVLAKDGDSWIAHNNLGNLLREAGRAREAERHYRRAIGIRRDDPQPYCNLSLLLSRAGRVDEAVDLCRTSIALRPQSGKPHYCLGVALARQGDHAGAVRSYRTAVELQPQLTPALNALAWHLATAPSLSRRDRLEAVALAERACKATLYENAAVLDTLAAACAAAGRFTDAVEMQRKAIAAAGADANATGTAAMRQRLRLYESGRPYVRKLTPAAGTTRPGASGNGDPG
jgi:Flp pilus assembly protein TadD